MWILSSNRGHRWIYSYALKGWQTGVKASKSFGSDAKQIVSWMRLVSSTEMPISASQSNCREGVLYLISKNIKNATYSSDVHTLERSEVESALSQLFGRHGRIKDHVTILEFDEKAKFTQQKGFPIHLQEAVQNEIVRPMNEKQMEKVCSVNDKVIIQPILFTVKNDKSVTVAFDAGKVN